MRKPRPEMSIPEWVRVMLRAITLPLMILLFLIKALVWMVMCSIQYIRYGGEFALYSGDVNEVSLMATYQKMKKGYEAHIINEHIQHEEPCVKEESSTALKGELN